MRNFQYIILSFLILSTTWFRYEKNRSQKLYRLSEQDREKVDHHDDLKAELTTAKSELVALKKDLAFYSESMPTGQAALPQELKLLKAENQDLVNVLSH